MGYCWGITGRVETDFKAFKISVKLLTQRSSSVQTRSILLTKTRWGISQSSKNLNRGDRVKIRPGSASQTTIANPVPIKPL